MLASPPRDEVFDGSLSCGGGYALMNEARGSAKTSTDNTEARAIEDWVFQESATTSPDITA